MQAITAGANPIAVKKGIDKAQEFLVQKLRENAKPVNGRNDIKVCGHMRVVGWRRRCIGRRSWEACQASRWPS